EVLGGEIGYGASHDEIGCGAGWPIEEPSAPEAPAAPSLTAGDAQISASWSAVAGATSYEVLYNTVDSVDGASVFTGNPVTGTSAIITGLTNGTAYYVFVRASNATGDSDYSVS